MYEPFDFATEVRHRDITAAGTIAEAVFHHGPAPTFRQIDALLAKNASDRAELRRMCLAVGEPLHHSIHRRLEAQRAQNVLQSGQHPSFRLQPGEIVYEEVISDRHCHLRHKGADQLKFRV